MDEQHLIPFLDRLGEEKFLRFLYVFLTIDKRYGITEILLRKKLGEDKETFRDDLNEMMDLQIIRKWRTNLLAGDFPGVLPMSQKWNDTVYTHRIDINNFIMCYEACNTDKALENCLAKCFRLMCWANRRFGVICDYPGDLTFETMKIMTKTRMCDTMKISRPTFKGFLKTASAPLLLSNKRFFRLFYPVNLENGKIAYMVNPDLFYHEDTDPLVFLFSNNPQYILKDFDKEYREKGMVK